MVEDGEVKFVGQTRRTIMQDLIIMLGIKKNFLKGNQAVLEDILQLLF